MVKLVSLLVVAISGGCSPTPPPDAGVTADSREGAGFAAPCTTHAECASGYCLTDRCSKRCASPSACPAAPSWSCALIPHQGSFCSCTRSGVEICDGLDNDCDGKVDDGAVCPGGKVCQAGSCACPAGKKDCGLCSDTSSDVDHCGDCTTSCPAAANAARTCVKGTCGYTCQKGFADCDGSATNGCEIANLTSDAANCGRCGRSCLGGACSGGMCQLELVVDKQYGLHQIAIDGTDLFWSVGDKVRRVSLSNKAVVTLAAGYAPGPLGVDATAVYFSGADEVVAVPKLGGSVLVLASGQVSSNGAGVDSTDVYWAAMPANELRKVPKAGGAVTTLVMGLTVLRALAVNVAGVFWADGGTLFKIPTAGGTATTLATKTFVRSLAIDATHAYWTTYSGEVLAVSVSGGPTATLASGLSPELGGMAIDATHVYWPVLYGGTVMKVSKTGGAPSLLAAQRNLPAEVAVDATHVYWAEPAEIWRTPK